MRKVFAIVFILAVITVSIAYAIDSSLYYNIIRNNQLDMGYSYFIDSLGKHSFTSADHIYDPATNEGIVGQDTLGNYWASAYVVYCPNPVNVTFRKVHYDESGAEEFAYVILSRGLYYFVGYIDTAKVWHIYIYDADELLKHISHDPSDAYWYAQTLFNTTIYYYPLYKEDKDTGGGEPRENALNEYMNLKHVYADDGQGSYLLVLLNLTGNQPIVLNYTTPYETNKRLLTFGGGTKTYAMILAKTSWLKITDSTTYNFTAGHIYYLEDVNVYNGSIFFQSQDINETTTSAGGSAQLGAQVYKVWWDWTNKQHVDGLSNIKVKFLYANDTTIAEKYTDNGGFTGLISVPANELIKIRVYYEEGKYEERGLRLSENETHVEGFVYLQTNEGIKPGNVLVVKAQDTEGNPLEGVYVEVYEYIPNIGDIGGEDGDLYAKGLTNSYGKFATSVAPGHVHVYASYNDISKDEIVNVENDATVTFTFDLTAKTATASTSQYADTTGTQFENRTLNNYDLPLPDASEWWARNKDKVKLIVLVLGIVFALLILLWLFFTGVGAVKKAAKKAFRAIVLVPVIPSIAMLTDTQKWAIIGFGAGLFLAIVLLLLFKRVIIATRVYVVEDREPD